MSAPEMIQAIKESVSIPVMAKARIEPDIGDDMGFAMDLTFKAILDRDARSATTLDDDYVGDQLVGELGLELRPLDELKVSLGTRIEHWAEDNRRGTLELGYGDDTTFKAKAWIGASVSWSGFHLNYRLEYIHKDQRRQREPDQRWDVVRSKATMEVRW